MKTTDPVIHEFFNTLGLNQEETEVFLTLSKNGEMTVLQLSRLTDIPRTNLYRIIDRLKKNSLAADLIDNHRIKVKAATFENLKRLVIEKEIQIKNLKQSLPRLISVFPQINGLYQPNTHVLYYRGQSGIKQMLWNILKTEGEFRGYTYITPVEAIGKKFSVEWALEFNLRKIKARDLYSDSYLLSIKKNPYPKIISWPTWESKYISPEIISIDHQIDIYNDVVAYYDWSGTEIFGVEIHNQKVANLQKQIFDAMWKLAG